MVKRDFYKDLIKLLVISLFPILFCGVDLAAEESLTKSFLSFNEAEKIALKNSHSITSQKYVVQSTKEDAAAQKVKRYPTLSFEASSLFKSKIGSITLPGTGLSFDVGDHINWSVGPSLDFVIWDTGQITNMAKSLQKISEAEGQTLDYHSRQVLLNVRLAYIGVQMAKQQVRLVKDALNLARAQYADIREKKRVGTADLLDLTVAHEEIVDRERDLERAQGELAVNKRRLMAALGFDSSIPLAQSLQVESIAKVLQRLLPQSEAYVDIGSHPQVQALSDKQRSAELAAKSSSARHWPKITMHGTSGFEYPNLGENTTIQQNELLLGMQFPIFDWGMISKESRSFKYKAFSALEKKMQTKIDLSRDVQEIRDRIKTLKELRAANVKAVRDAVEVARLSYESYKAGRIIFLDVQRANVKALAVKINSTQTDAELAMQISRLLALAEGVGEIE